MIESLFLFKHVNDLASVLAEVGIDEADVHPVGAGLWVVLPDELVEG